MSGVADIYREVADKVWEISEEYEESYWGVASDLKEIAQKLHEMARNSELHAEDPYNFPLTPIETKVPTDK